MMMKKKKKQKEKLLQLKVKHLVKTLLKLKFWKKKLTANSDYVRNIKKLLTT